MSLPILSNLRVKSVQLTVLSTFALGSFASCEKKSDSPQASAAVEKSQEVSSQGWAAQSDKWGFAAHIPQNASLYLGSVNFKKHLEALKASQYWKQFGAFLDDQSPAPTAENEQAKTLEKLWGDDFFIAGGHNLSKSAKTWRLMSELQSEISIRTLFAGITPNGAANVGATQVFQQFLSAPTLIDKTLEIIKELEAPSLILGAKTAEPQKIIDEILSAETKKELEAKKIVLSEHKNKQGVNFTVATWKVGDSLTQEQVDAFLKNLGEQPADFKAKVSEALGVLREKTIKVALGQHQQHVLFIIFQDPAELDFAESPEKSILSNAQLAKLLPYHNNDLTSLGFISADLLKSITTNQPLRPYVDGLVGALKDTESFAEIGKRLEPQAKELEQAEQKVYTYSFTDAAIVSWWKDGIHIEAVGGSDPRSFDLKKPLKYASLLEEKNIIFGFSAHSQPEFSQNFNLWVEHLASFLYNTTKELTQSGMFGPESAQQIAMGEMMVIPTWTKIYGSLKDLFLKGLDTESLIIVDLNGKNELPNAPKDAPSTGFPRYFSVYDVKDLDQVKSSWKNVNDTINGLLTMFGMGSEQAGGASGGLLQAPQSEEVHGMTQWFYPTPTLQGDLLPNATLNEKHLILSSSKSGAKEIAKKLENASDSNLTGVHYKVEFQSIVDGLKAIEQLAPADKQEDVKNMKEMVRWLSPFHTLQGSLKNEGDDIRNSFSWEIQDPKSFD